MLSKKRQKSSNADDADLNVKKKKVRMIIKHSNSDIRLTLDQD